MDAFEKFSTSTSLRINPTKCKAYYGNVDDRTKQEIQDLSKDETSYNQINDALGYCGYCLSYFCLVCITFSFKKNNLQIRK